MSMIHELNEVYSLLPGFDCCLCNNPSCRAMARRIIMGLRRPEDCLVLKNNSERLQRLRSIFKEDSMEVYSGARILPKETCLTFIRPCISEMGKVMAETRLASSTNPILGSYDPIMLCLALELSEPFEDFRCSPSLGVARLGVGERTIMVFKDGRVNIRGAKDEEEVLETLSLVSRILWGALICPQCGNAGFDCVSGACEECQRDGCSILEQGPQDPRLGGRKVIGRGDTRKPLVEAMGKLRMQPYFEKGLKHFEEEVGLLVGLGNRLLEGNIGEGEYRAIVDLKAESLKFEKLGMKIMVEASELEGARVGLFIVGIALNTSRIAEGLGDILKAEKLSERDRKLLKEALRIAEEGYRSLSSGDRNLGLKVFEVYREFRKSWLEVYDKLFKDHTSFDDIRYFLAFGRLAASGFFMARLSVGKSL
ncbi:MAG: (Fe-S)-binding protein [Candidatus Bathyarchaeia archaeon]